MILCFLAVLRLAEYEAGGFLRWENAIRASLQEPLSGQTSQLGRLETVRCFAEQQLHQEVVIVRCQHNWPNVINVVLAGLFI